MRKINEIIIHCTATESGHDYSAKTIDQWHRARGFNQIGYHFIIHLDGSIENGRSIELAGAHCKGHNRHSIGIAYVGGLYCGQPKNTMTAAQMQSLITLIQLLISKYFTINKVSGHNDYSHKACPCFDVSKFLAINKIYV